jgi:hypothetical protein
MILSSFSANAACPKRTNVDNIGIVAGQITRAAHQDLRQVIDRSSPQ